MSGIAVPLLCHCKRLQHLQACQHLVTVRLASGYTRRIFKQEQIKDVVHQYVGKNPRRSDRIYVWGSASTGALGIATFLKPEEHQAARNRQLAPQRLNFMEKRDLKVKDISCGYGSTVFICETEKHKHLALGTGLNFDSQLGFQEFPRRSGRLLDYVIQPAVIELPLVNQDTTRMTHVASGRAHTIIATNTEGVFALGNNAYGQCGRPIVDGEVYRGSQSVNRVQLDENVKIRKIVCGQDHTLFLTESGQVYSCGLGTDGQTGLGHYDCVGPPTLVNGDIKGEAVVELSSKADTILAVSEKGHLFGWGNAEYQQLCDMSGDEMQVNIPRHIPIKGIDKVVKVAASGSMCALLDDKGGIYTWGYGILGKGPLVTQSNTPQQIPSTLFGVNEFNPNVKVVDVFCGLYHFAALTELGDLYTWGKNRSACLGLGHVLDQFFPYKVQVSAEVSRVFCGVDHMVVLCKSFA